MKPSAWLRPSKEQRHVLAGTTTRRNPMLRTNRLSAPSMAAVLFVSAGLLLVAASARAQIATPAGPGQPDRAIDADARKAVVDTLCDRIERYYVFPERARAASQAIRKRYRRHEYDRITSAGDFADSLTAHLQIAVHDLHL